MVKESIKKSLIAAWVEFANVRFAKLDVGFPKNGVPELSSAIPRVTGDSKEVVAMDTDSKFLRIIRDSIAPKISNLLHSHYPQELDRQLS
jgi:hypothetical protein